MSSRPFDEEADGDETDAADADDDEFVRAVARVEDRSPPQRSPRFEGTKLGHFNVCSELGRGGMGIVFLAEDETLRRKVALKVLRPSFAADSERRKRFLREARAAAAVSHPNLVTIYDAGEHDGHAYLAMEYLRGSSLRQILAERQLAVSEVLEVARQVLAGLAHAHAAGLLHRDLKPENVLAGSDGRVTLLDFGLAKLPLDVDTSGDHATKDGHVLGTYGYMSPEQARGQSVDVRTDIFSFGVLLYEMFTRQRPFAGSSIADEITALLRDDPPPVHTVRPEVSREISDVVRRCLAKKADERYPSAEALATALASAERAPSRARSLRPLGTRSRKAIAVAATVTAAGIALGALWPRPTVANKADDAVERRGIAITDHPPPRSPDPGAVALYAQALQAIRDADWAIAESRLNDALARDPNLVEAHLRFAILTIRRADVGPSVARDAFGKAMADRAKLTERDRAFLFAFEPIVNRDPPEQSLTTSRLREMSVAYPDDAEVWHYFDSFGAEGTSEAIEAARRTVALDPQFADAWQMLAGHLAKEGRIDEAHAAIDRCIAISPLSADCRGERAGIYSRMGACAEMEADLRRGLSSNPRASAMWHEDRAAALLALGRSDETILEVLRKKWTLYADDQRAGIEAFDRARLAVVRGRFGEAYELLAQGERAIDHDPNADTHARHVQLRVALALEMGRERDAASFAQRYVRRKDAWIGSARWNDPEIPMLRVMQRSELLSKSELIARRDAWYQARSSDPGAPAMRLWRLAFADSIDTRDEAEEALDNVPEHSERQYDQTEFKAIFGRTYLLAGRPEWALAHLEVATLACNWFYWPLSHTQSLLALGRAREHVGNEKGACEAYQRVLERWGATPGSRSATEAKARAHALACVPKPKGVVSFPRPASRAPSNTSVANDGDDDDDSDETPSHRQDDLDEFIQDAVKSALSPHVRDGSAPRTLHIQVRRRFLESDASP